MPRIVLTTVGSLDEANRIARGLVEEHLAACVSILPAMQSVYRWKGNIESASEVLLMIKTGLEQLPALETRLHQLHSYETPEFLVLNVESGSHAYLAWLRASLEPGTGLPG
jgi:periplasmic divalent cation tolerance protein